MTDPVTTQVEGGNSADDAAVPTAKVERMDISDKNDSKDQSADASMDIDAETKDKANTDECDGKESEDSSSTDVDSGDDDEDGDILTTEQTEERLIQATTHKEQGNAHFKAGDLDLAARSYRRGVRALDPVHRNPEMHDNEQYKSLKMALQTNWSMIAYKQKKYKLAVQVATQAVSVDANNVKALYRRALAQRATGNHEAARSDLKQALQVDPNNGACKKELAALKKQMDGQRASQKKALAKAFGGSSGSFLYNDKEEKEKKKAEEAKRKKQAEQELYKKRKAEWEDECVKRMANNEAAISFEEWEKEQKEAAEAKQKEEEKKRKAEEKKRKEEERKRRAERKAAAKDDSDSEGDQLTEEEMKMFRGYKKTKYGRTTSYFTRELSAEEKQKIGDIAPKRLDATNNGNAPSPIPQPASTTAASKWNQAGTWEEKNTTAWCRDRLEERLKGTTVANEKLEACIASVSDLTGDASVAIAGNKKRYIFDFHAKLKYEFKEAGTDDVIAKGNVALPDICSGHHEEIEVSFSSWSKKPNASFAEEASQLQNQLATQIRANIQVWVQEFNSQY